MLARPEIQAAVRHGLHLAAAGEAKVVVHVRPTHAVNQQEKKVSGAQSPQVFGVARLGVSGLGSLALRHAWPSSSFTNRAKRAPTTGVTSWCRPSPPETSVSTICLGFCPRVSRMVS